MFTKDQAVAAAAVPPAGISGLTVLGVSLPDWVLIATILYTTLSTYVLLRDKFYTPWKERRDGRQGQTPVNP